MTTSPEAPRVEPRLRRRCLRTHPVPRLHFAPAPGSLVAGATTPEPHACRARSLSSRPGSPRPGRAPPGGGAMLRRRGLMLWALGAPAAALVAGCGGAPAAGSEPRPAARLGPLTIDVVTRSPVAAATGHSQWYDHAAKTTFTPETGVTVNLIDGLPSVTEKLTVMASAGTPPDGSWFPTMSDGSGGRELS